MLHLLINQTKGGSANGIRQGIRDAKRGKCAREKDQRQGVSAAGPGPQDVEKGVSATEKVVSRWNRD